jgi:glycosyltransferase involved in cell wall biosynthesis
MSIGTIGIALPTLSDGDAVGNDVMGMAAALRRRGHEVRVFARNGHATEPFAPPEEMAAALSRPEDVLIYHHSIGCDWAVKATEKLPCRKAVKYHNVTPPHFFAKFNAEVARGCEQGLRERKRLARTPAHLWADSAFNAADFEEAGGRGGIEVVAPFHQTDALAAVEPDRGAVSGLDDWATNILLVGRLVPNKNIPLAVRAVTEYARRYDPTARLVIVGDRPVVECAAEVDEAVREGGRAGQVIVTGKVTVAQLKALYLSSDALLVTSLHEGFCVPLVEAMGLRTPVVALPNAAVPGTGGDAVTYADATPESIAAALHAVIGDPTAREAQLERGRRRYAEHYDNAAIERRFLALFDKLTA